MIWYELALGSASRAEWDRKRRAEHVYWRDSAFIVGRYQDGWWSATVLAQGIKAVREEFRRSGAVWWPGWSDVLDENCRVVSCNAESPPMRILYYETESRWYDEPLSKEDAKLLREFGVPLEAFETRNEIWTSQASWMYVPVVWHAAWHMGRGHRLGPQKWMVLRPSWRDVMPGVERRGWRWKLWDMDKEEAFWAKTHKCKPTGFMAITEWVEYDGMFFQARALQLAGLPGVQSVAEKPSWLLLEQREWAQPDGTECRAVKLETWQGDEVYWAMAERGSEVQGFGFVPSLWWALDSGIYFDSWQHAVSHFLKMGLTWNPATGEIFLRPGRL